MSLLRALAIYIALSFVAAYLLARLIDPKENR